MKKANSWVSLLLMSTVGLMLGGCACLNTPVTEKPGIDPYEPVNRVVFKFNQKADKYVIKPVALGYGKAVPQTIQGRVSSFFDNLREITTSANDILQGKFGQFANDASRFVINSTIGIFGTFDPASHLGLERHKEDFGQTLAVWGYKNSAYLVLPLLGPSTVRDTAGTAVDFNVLSVWPAVESDKTKYGLVALDLIDIRAQLLKTENVVKAIAVDEYVFTRDAYLQRRKFLITDGQSAENLPDDSMDDENTEAGKANPNSNPNSKPVSKSESFPGEGADEEIVK